MGTENVREQVLEHNEVKQFVCFKLAKEEYAVDIHNVQEVIRVPKITPVPQMPVFCLGVINIRGNVSAVFDLRKMFHLEEKEFDEKTKLLVITLNDTTVSLVVDEISENIKLEASHIDPAPTVKMKIERECISGLGELDGRMIVIIDMPKLHDMIMHIIYKEEKKS